MPTIFGEKKVAKYCKIPFLKYISINKEPTNLGEGHLSWNNVRQMV